MKYRIICDLDSIVVDIMTPWLAEYNQKYGENLTEESFPTWDMHKYAKAGKAIYAIIDQPGWFRHRDALPGALESLQKLVDAKHEVLLVTAAVFASNYADKVEWVKEYVPFISKKNLVLTDAKHIIAADVLIDDGPHNAEAYRKEYPLSKIMTIGYPYNKDCPHYDAICGSYKDTRAAWAKMVEEIG